MTNYEDALASYDKALDIDPNAASVWYSKACCYAQLGKDLKTIENLQQAIDINPHRYSKLAKTNPDFDRLRKDERFKIL